MSKSHWLIIHGLMAGVNLAVAFSCAASGSVLGCGINILAFFVNFSRAIYPAEAGGDA